MARLIETFPLRPQLSLDGVWDFVPESKPLKTPPPSKAFSEKLPVPGVWASELRHFDYRGFGWYRRVFTWPGKAPATLRLAFGAVSHTADVFLDGKRLGSHHGAHTAFDFIVPAVKPGLHTLCVRVGNVYGPDNPLYYPQQDIYLFGGIPQSVVIESLPADSIRSASAVPRKTGARWMLDVSAGLHSASGQPAAGQLRVSLDGRSLGVLKIGRSGAGRATFDAGPVKLWSPESPTLSLVRLETEEDAWQERIGFRTVEVRGRQILLNGKALTLKGVNRHEHHPDFGSALPATIHARDIAILKTLGANFVRGSHYPNDPLFLDLCDENGLLFWDELSHWQPRKEDFQNPLFLRRSLEQLDDMVAQHRHHPSIILWGMLNEAATFLPIARPVVKALARRFRKLDPTRPITFASCSPNADVCLDLVDVVSLNAYPGWYSGTLDVAGATMTEHIRNFARRAGGKPLIVSEFGAGGLTGARSFEDRKWTENYQAELLIRLMDAIRETRRACGVAIWQYCDVRTSAAHGLGRIREYNNKGILSDYREPKMAFYALQKSFRSFKA
jgi:beta-glucuronidase